jgi:DNA-binding transcriptional LysR family regulator
MHKIRAINAFVRVMELGSFTKAAQSLGISKTNISRPVVMLEQMMCEKLLHLTNRSVAVTPQRAQYYEISFATAERSAEPRIDLQMAR